MIVVTHPEQGIFVGAAMGFAFWTRCDSGGQDQVCTFESVDQAKDFIRAWINENDPTQYGYAEVTCRGDFSATAEELCRAGLADLLGDLGMPLDGAPKSLNG